VIGLASARVVTIGGLSGERRKETKEEKLFNSVGLQKSQPVQKSGNFEKKRKELGGAGTTVNCIKIIVMSTTETLHTQLDNLHLEIQRLEFENKKLKDEQQLNSSEVETQYEQLTKEVEELLRSLHEVQENEVSCNEELYASHEERDKLQRKNEQLVHELVQSRARCEDVTSELTRVVESTELAQYRFVEAERASRRARGGPCAA